MTDIKIGMAIGVLIASLLGCGTSSDCEISIAPFQGDRAGALSFTFDDGSQNQFDIGVAYLDEFGFKGTFNVISGLTRDKKSDPLSPDIPKDENWARVSWEEWSMAIARGHEIGNHTLTHPWLIKISDEELERQIVESTRLIERKLGQAPLTFAYPWSVYNDSIQKLVLDHHIAARQYDDQTIYGNHKKPFTLVDANAVADDAISNHRWRFAMIHGIDEPWAPLDSRIFHDHLEYCKSRESELWVDTFANVGRYRLERDNALIRILSGSPGQVVFTLTCSLDPEIFDIPLTLVIAPVDKAAAIIKAIREGAEEIPSPRIKEGKILIDVSPGPEKITVSWTKKSPTHSTR